MTLCFLHTSPLLKRVYSKQKVLGHGELMFSFVSRPLFIEEVKTTFTQLLLLKKFLFPVGGLS